MISNLRSVLFQALFLSVLTMHTAAVYRVLLLHAIHHTRQYCHCVTNKPTYHTTYSEDESILSPDIMQCLAMSTYTSVCSITESPELVSLLQWDTWLDSPLGWPRCPGWGSTERTQRGEISGEAPLPAWLITSHRTALSIVELETNLHEVLRFTITKKASTRA